MTDHDKFMDEALALALKGRGWVSPNPMVGALVVKDGTIVGRGWHKQFGGPHAEIFALQEAGEKARGATLYCTLEPCNHTGKTPPCTQALVQAGIARVVIGARDAHPLAGGGATALSAAGIEVIHGVLEGRCRAINAPFMKFVATQLPFVTLKWAMSADGKIATASGDSKWISGEEARAVAHGMRGAHDAVLVGIETLLADGSRLTCRTSNSASLKQPRRVILDSSARTPLDAPIFKEPGGPITIVVAAAAPAERLAALRNKGVDVLCIESAEKRPPLRRVLSELAQRGVLSILVEGGSRVLGSFIDERLADRACIFVAPILIGGAGSLTPVGGRGNARLAEALEMGATSVRTLGRDILLTGSLSAWEWQCPDVE